MSQEVQRNLKWLNLIQLWGEEFYLQSTRLSKGIVDYIISIITHFISLGYTVKLKKAFNKQRHILQIEWRMGEKIIYQKMNEGGEEQ